MRRRLERGCSRWRARLFGALAVAHVVFPRVARACEPVFEPSSLEYPRFEPPLGARVVKDSYTVACDTASCTVTATLVVDVPSETHVFLRGRRAHDAMFSVDGGAPAADVTMPPNTKQLVVTAKVDLWDYADDCHQTGISARHPVLGGAHARDVQYPLKLETSKPPPVAAAAGWDVAADQGFDEDRHVATVWLTPPPPNYYAGGPVALVGVASGTGNTVRARLGWELAVPRPWLVESLALDTDFSSLATVAATAELVSNAWVLPLSYGGGAGVVTELAPSVHAGGRVFASAALGPGRATVSLDVLANGDVSFGLFIGGSL